MIQLPSEKENTLNHSNLSIDRSQLKDSQEASLTALKSKIYAQRRQNKTTHDAIACRLPSFQHELRPRIKCEDSHSLISHYDLLLEEAAFLQRYMAKLQCVRENQNESDSFGFLIDGWRKGEGTESCDERMDRMAKNIRFVRQGIEAVAAKQTYQQTVLVQFVKHSKEFKDLKKQFEEANAERQREKMKFLSDIEDLKTRNGQLVKINQQLTTKNKALQTNQKRLTLKLQTLNLQYLDSSTQYSNRSSKEYSSLEKDSQNRPQFHLHLQYTDSKSTSPTITTRSLQEIIEFLEYTPTQNSFILRDISLSNISLKDLTDCSEQPTFSEDLLIGLDKLEAINWQPYKCNSHRPKLDRNRDIHFSTVRPKDPTAELRFIRRK